MKKIFFTLAAIALAAGLVSCNKDQATPDMSIQNGEPVKCVFNLASVGSPITKSTGLESDDKGTDAEKAVSSLQVFVFGSDNLLIASGSAANVKTLSLTVNSGTGYSIYAVANCEDFLSSVSKVADLEAKVTNVLNTDDGATNFAMSGKLTNQVVSKDSKEFTIEVARRASKIVVRKITNSLPVASGALTIEGIYLANVVTAAGMFTATLPDTPVWVNQFGTYASLSSHAWFGDKLETAVDVANAGDYSVAHTFYASANPTETDSSEKGEFTARFTRLVIKAKIQGVDYYYPIQFNKELSALVPNRFIDISNINIKHLGSDDPDVPVSTDAITVTVTVKDWDRSEESVEI